MGEPIRILLVDDQPHFAELAKAFLEQADDRFEIDTVTGGPAGLERLEADRYDCVVSDQEMPEMTGLELFDVIEEREIDVPFILFTGVDADTIDDDRFAGVSAYLQKGGKDTLKALARRIRLAVQEHRADRDPLDVHARYNALFEQGSMAMAWVHANGAAPAIVDHNDRFIKEFEGNPGSLVGADLDELLCDVTLDADVIERSIATGEPVTVDGERIGHEDIRHYRWQVLPVGDDESGNHALLAVNDVSKQATNEHELEMYRTIVEASGDPMYVLDITGEFIYVNDALVELTGYAREEIVGANGELVMDETDYRRGTDLIKELLRSDEDTATFEMSLRTATGDTIPCENHVTLLYNVETGTGEEVKGTAGVLRDISDRKERIAELRRYNERLEELAAFISHDLRNPINIAAGHLNLVEATDGNEHLHAIGRSLQRMEELIDDLLMLARSGQSVNGPEPIELPELINLSWGQVSADQASLTVMSEQTIVADSSRVRQLFENLFTNAIIHGGDDVAITVGDLEDGFYVADDGPGIPPPKRGDVFDFGYTTGDDGTGFGLSIVKAVTEAHNWSVSLTEGEDGGARFEFTGVEVATIPASKRAEH